MAKNSKSTRRCGRCKCKEVCKTQDSSQQAYFKQIFGKTNPEKERIAFALTQAHENRRFEIGLYWQRSLFFWGFDVLFFAGFMALFQTANGAKKPEGILVYLLLFWVAVLGIMSTILWFRVERASRSWQKNWEQHINLLELPITGNLHKSIIGKRDQFYAPHKIHKTFIVSIGIIWGVLMAAAGWVLYEKDASDDAVWIAVGSFAVAFILVVLQMLLGDSFWRTSKTTMSKEPVLDITIKDRNSTYAKELGLYEKKLAEVSKPNEVKE